MECKKLTQLWTVTGILLIFLIFHCSAFRNRNGNDIEESFSVAVLDFEQEGFISGGKLDQFAADELTTLLFLKKKARVVDRSQVTAVFADKGISSSVMNIDQIRQLGQALNADYLILGKIIRFDEEMFDPENKEEVSIQITFRIISTEDGSVAGMANLKRSRKGEVKSIVGDMLEEMAGTVKLK